MNKLWKICRAGKYPQGEITPADLTEIAGSYNPSFHEAPITLDHNQSGPAYGWIDKVEAKGDSLYASFKEVTKELLNLNHEKKYKRPSVEIAQYDGKKYLRAVSFVTFPQVKSLPAIEFNETENLTFILSDSDLNFESEFPKNTKIKMNQKILKFAESLGITLSETTSPDDALLAFAEKADSLMKEITGLESKYNALAKKNSEVLVDSAIAEGKILPADKDTYMKFAESDYDGCVKLFASLDKKNMFDKNQTSTKVPNGADLDAKKKFKADGTPITYAEILKDPNLQKNFSESELDSLRQDYLNI